MMHGKSSLYLAFFKYQTLHQTIYEFVCFFNSLFKMLKICKFIFFISFAPLLNNHIMN